MSQIKTLALILISLSTLCSCAKLGLKIGFDVVNIDPPANEATAEETAKINSAIKRIEKISKELGSDFDFDRVPIVVTSAPMPTATSYALCSTDENGEGRYIVLSRNAFIIDSGNKRSSLIFGLILHEIGHCYFHRSHDDRGIAKDGFAVEVEDSDTEGSEKYSFDKFPISVMTTKIRNFGTPKALEKYYVGEILGRAGIQSADDAEHISGVRFIPVNGTKKSLSGRRD